MQIKLGTKNYDTTKAELIGVSNNTDSLKHEALYRKKKTMEFFLFCQTEEDVNVVEGTIIPLTFEQAQKWAYNNLDSDTYNSYFVCDDSKPKSTGEKTEIVIRAKNIDKIYEQKLNMIRSATGKTFSEILMTLLDDVNIDDFNDSIKPENEHVGETVVANCNMKMTIIAWHNNFDIDVKFDDGTIVKHKTYTNFKKGNIGHPDYQTKIEKNKMHIGETNKSHKGQTMEIIDYRNSKSIDVKFLEDGTVVKEKTYQSFKSGFIKNPNYP